MSIIGVSTMFIKKYPKKREREDKVGHMIEFDPHWDCLFFKYC
jgi:hypothetical protein